MLAAAAGAGTSVGAIALGVIASIVGESEGVGDHDDRWVEFSWEVMKSLRLTKSLQVLYTLQLLFTCVITRSIQECVSALDFDHQYLRRSHKA